MKERIKALEKETPFSVLGDAMPDQNNDDGVQAWMIPEIMREASLKFTEFEIHDTNKDLNIIKIDC